MPTRHIALVPESGMNPSDLARVSAGLQKQVTRDLAPIWDVSATVDPFPSLEDIPAGYWPLVLTFRNLGGDGGIHIDSNGQPYALVEMSPSWSLTASHVCLEMLTDPFGGRTFPGLSPRSDQGDVEFMGGVCDACEHPDNAYLVNDVLVSDFCTPAFWEHSPSSTERRSFTGAVESSLQVLPGGHLSWYDPATNSWWLRRHADGALSDIKVGVADPRRGTVREFVSGHVPHLESTKMTLEAFEARTGVPRQRALRASQSRAYWLRASVENLQHDDAVRAVLGGARSPRDASAGRQSLSALLRMSMGTCAPEAPEEGLDDDGRRVPEAPGASQMDDPTIVVDESVFEQEATMRGGARARERAARRSAPRDAEGANPNAANRHAPDRRGASNLGGTPAAFCDPTAQDSRQSRTVPPPLPSEAPDAPSNGAPNATAFARGPLASTYEVPAPTRARVTVPFPPGPPDLMNDAEMRDESMPPMPAPQVRTPAPQKAARPTSIPPVSGPPEAGERGASRLGRASLFALGAAAAVVVAGGIVAFRTREMAPMSFVSGAMREAPQSVAVAPPAVTPAASVGPIPAGPVVSATPAPVATDVPPSAASIAGGVATVNSAAPPPAARIFHAAPARASATPRVPLLPSTAAPPPAGYDATQGRAQGAAHPPQSQPSIDSLVDDRR
jgi:hypothetical protein